MYSNPSIYSGHNKGQVADATNVLRRLSISWADQDFIMDAGCGTGDITKHLLCNISPTVSKVVGVDILPGMVRYAQEFNNDPKISYHEADLQDRCTFQHEWFGALDKIFSFTALHWVPNHVKVFENFYSCLKHNGEVFAYFVYEFPRWNKAFNSVMTGRWQKYLANFRTTHIAIDNIGELSNQKWLKSADPLEEYRLLVEGLGFKLKHIESNFTDGYVYSTDDYEHILLAVLPQLSMIPEDMHINFVKDFFVALDLPVTESGMVNAADGCKFMLIHAVKC